jgi:hypothetical protein
MLCLPVTKNRVGLTLSQDPAERNATELSLKPNREKEAARPPGPPK